MSKWQYWQSGDTLVEVVMSMAILAVVLVTSFDIANRSYSEGFQAREHTQAIYLAQEQAEKLYAFRNNLITQAVAANNPASVMQATPGYFDLCDQSPGCHFDTNSTVPVAKYTSPTVFNGITYYVVIGPLTGKAHAINNNEGAFTVTVSWSSAVGTGAVAIGDTGDTGTNQNTSTLNLVMIDNRGIVPRDCSIAGSDQCT